MIFASAFGGEERLQNDGGTDLIDISFYLSVLLLHATVDHRPLCHRTGESFIHQRQGFIRESGLKLISQFSHQGCHIGVSRIEFSGKAQYQLVDNLLSEIVIQKCHQAMTLHSGKGGGNNSQGVRDGQPGAFHSIIYGYYSSHPMRFIPSRYT